jgi:hypothetical protein
MGKRTRFWLYPRHLSPGPHTPDFLCSFVGSLNFMRLSLKRAAHEVLSRAAYRKFGASRSFFARCGIPQASPSSLSRVDRSTRVPHVRTSVRGTKMMGEALPQLCSDGPDGYSTPLPQPPPPGVSMCRMSPLAKCWLHLPGKAIRSSPACAASHALPQAPSSPPCKP